MPQALVTICLGVFQILKPRGLCRAAPNSCFLFGRRLQKTPSKRHPDLPSLTMQILRLESTRVERKQLRSFYPALDCTVETPSPRKRAPRQWSPGAGLRAAPPPGCNCSQAGAIAVTPELPCSSSRPPSFSVVPSHPKPHPRAHSPALPAAGTVRQGAGPRVACVAPCTIPPGPPPGRADWAGAKGCAAGTQQTQVTAPGGAGRAAVLQEVLFSIGETDLDPRPQLRLWL
ncbi:RILP-like protein 2 isoform X1 [Pongo abelii]|uniref:RILP-like protein 2 isoform X1 n=1 Tax=Pongo abelii TaxID=9601 RepID=UPI0023E82559|nr:RILP-like protein 2 isoform X1 [Pongo abelii]